MRARELIRIYPIAMAHYDQLRSTCNLSRKESRTPGSCTIAAHNVDAELASITPEFI